MAVKHSGRQEISGAIYSGTFKVDPVVSRNQAAHAVVLQPLYIELDYILGLAFGTAKPDKQRPSFRLTCRP
jgi:hypothetical protein